LPGLFNQTEQIRMGMSSEPNTQTAAIAIPGGEAVYKALVGLLARAGLEYSGGFVQVEDFRVHYLDYGHRDSDLPPVVLMHGAGPGSGNWYGQIAALRETRRVIAMDSPLFGLSDLADQDGHPTESVARISMHWELIKQISLDCRLAVRSS
jgi:hypothetical protein